MITIRQQGWITRWDKSRLHSEKKYFYKLLNLFAPYTATASIILLLGFGVVSYKNVVDDNQNISNRVTSNIIFGITGNRICSWLTYASREHCYPCRYHCYDHEHGQCLSHYFALHVYHFSIYASASSHLRRQRTLTTWTLCPRFKRPIPLYPRGLKRCEVIIVYNSDGYYIV